MVWKCEVQPFLSGSGSHHIVGSREIVVEKTFSPKVLQGGIGRICRIDVLEICQHLPLFEQFALHSVNIHRSGGNMVLNRDVSGDAGSLSERHPGSIRTEENATWVADTATGTNRPSTDFGTITPYGI